MKWLRTGIDATICHRVRGDTWWTRLLARQHEVLDYTRLSVRRGSPVGKKAALLTGEMVPSRELPLSQCQATIACMCLARALPKLS